jgi:Mn2+/Fe2+ NRAMP family transporter
MKKQTTRICIEIITGIILSVVIIFIAIAIAYAIVHAKDLSNFNLNFLGLPIYKISKTSNDFKGVANTDNMMLFGVVCSVLSVLLGELFFGLHFRTKKA